MTLIPALILCVLTPVAALLLAPSIVRTSNDWIGVALSCVIAVAGPLVAVWTVH